MKSTFSKALFDHSSIGIIVSNMDGYIEQANPFVGKIFGYESYELIGNIIEILIPVPLRIKHMALRQIYNENPVPRAMGNTLNLKGVRKDGSEFPVEVSLSCYDYEGTQNIVSFISDITDRNLAEMKLKDLTSDLEKKVKERTKELSEALSELNHINKSLEREIEQRILAEEKMKEALSKEKELSEMKSRFVSMASHEFRTPLSGILSSVSLIERYNTPELEERRQKHVQTIKRSVKNLTSILNDFLSIEKIDQGIVDGGISTFSLNDFLISSIDEFGSLIDQERKVNLILPEEEIILKKDKDMLRNIFINLITNAIKYSEKDKPIEIEVKAAYGRAIMQVRDFGFGIPIEDQKYIFTRFFRGKNVSTIQGTGLGLIIVKRYLDMMDGNIYFESEEGKGTTFTFSLEAEEIKHEKNTLN